jgi:hypothetical protein
LLYVKSNKPIQGLELLANGNNQSLFYAKKDLLQLWKDGFRTVVIYLDQSQSSQEDYEEFLGVKGDFYADEELVLLPLPRP